MLYNESKHNILCLSRHGQQRGPSRLVEELGNELALHLKHPIMAKKEWIFHDELHKGMNGH